MPSSRPKMTERNPDRDASIKTFESEAEVLVVYQLDLLAQLEAQVRAVHRTMRCIEKLRGGRDRVGPELTNGERSETLTTLASELAAIDQELHVQHQSCEDMQRSIRGMQARLSSLRRATEQPITKRVSGTDPARASSAE